LILSHSGWRETGFINISDAGSDISLGVLARLNMLEGKAIPYVGLRLGALHFVPKDGESVTDFIAGLAVGGEYFLAQKFSLGVEGQFNFAKSDKNSSRFNNPDGTNFNTASAVSATFYF